MDKKIMLTILLNQTQVMDSIAKFILEYASEKRINAKANNYLDIAESLIKRSKETKALMEKYL